MRSERPAQRRKLYQYRSKVNAWSARNRCCPINCLPKSLNNVESTGNIMARNREKFSALRWIFFSSALVSLDSRLLKYISLVTAEMNVSISPSSFSFMRSLRKPRRASRHEMHFAALSLVIRNESAWLSACGFHQRRQICLQNRNL